ncbi:MAG: hypothetical protein RL701_5877 [Pseudomonadota bacterium]|jgi:hypothetical protein
MLVLAAKLAMQRKLAQAKQTMQRKYGGGLMADGEYRGPLFVRDGWAMTAQPLDVPDGQFCRWDIAVGRRSLITWNVGPTYKWPDVVFTVIAGEIVAAAAPENEVEEYEVP